MKIINAVAFAAFIAQVQAFGPAQPLTGGASITNTGTGPNTVSMRVNIGDARKRSRIVNLLKQGPTPLTKAQVQTELLTDHVSQEIASCSWDVQKALVRKIQVAAYQYDLDVPEGFGVPPTQPEREAQELADGAIRKVAKEAAMKAEVEHVTQARVAAKAKRVAKKQRAAEAAALLKTRLAGSGLAGASAAAAPPKEETAAAAPAVAAAAAPASSNAVTPTTIKQLRDDTGAGMMDCKRALLDSDGDQQAAAEALRKKGLATADKKATRIASEGKIAVGAANGKAVMVEVNCETDFVGKDATFLAYCGTVAGAAATLDNDNIDDLMTQEVDGTSLETSRQALVAKIGENIQVRRMASRGTGTTTVGGYVHMGTIGVLVELDGGDEQLCTDIAMHVTAMNPPFATADDVPEEVLATERRVLTEQAVESGKPPEIAEKMVEGRIRKFLEEKCLVSQNYVKDTDLTVQQLLDKNDAKMIGFTRLVVGEGIEKKTDDFAAEVAAMAGGK